MSGFARPARKLTESGIGVAAAPTGGMGLALDEKGRVPLGALPCPIFDSVGTSQTTASLTYTDLATVGPSFTVPETGTYFVSWGATMEVGAVADRLYVAVKKGSAAASDNDAATLAGTSAGASVVREATMALTAGDVVKLQYRAENGTTGTFLKRWIKAIRVVP